MSQPKYDNLAQSCIDVADEEVGAWTIIEYPDDRGCMIHDVGRHSSSLGSGPAKAIYHRYEFSNKSHARAAIRQFGMRKVIEFLEIRNAKR